MKAVSSSRLPCGELSAANGLFCTDGNLQHVVTPPNQSCNVCYDHWTMGHFSTACGVLCPLFMHGVGPNFHISLYKSFLMFPRLVGLFWAGIFCLLSSFLDAWLAHLSPKNPGGPRAFKSFFVLSIQIATLISIKRESL